MLRRTLFLMFIAPAVVQAQETRIIDLGRGDKDHRWVRLDGGFDAGGCQGSFMREVDWSQVHPGPHKAEHVSYWPAWYAEVEFRPWERLGIVAHTDRWKNGRSIEAGDQGYNYYSAAETYLIGGRWYFDFDTPRMEWYTGMMGGWSHNSSYGSPGVPVMDQSYFAHQITLIGFRRSGPFGISMELGQGYKGFFSIGLSASF